MAINEIPKHREFKHGDEVTFKGGSGIVLGYAEHDNVSVLLPDDRIRVVPEWNLFKA